MINPVAIPAAIGDLVDGEHRFPVRVYFEDTDLSGVVYHGNYVRFLDRARNDMLSAMGIDQRGAFESGRGVYAIVDLAIRFRRPARLHDDLTVISRIRDTKAASCVIQQRVMCGRLLVAEAEVIAAFLSPEGKPRRQPEAWLDAFRRLKGEDTLS
jgi:acyl-CoA thioester hydrolase